MLFDNIPDTEQYLRQISDGLTQGRAKESIQKSLAVTGFDELYEIALARKQAHDKTSQHLYFTRDDLRFATNELVAAYRAKRLTCDTLIEIGAGIGIQTLAFAKTCKNVIAIEIDARKTAYLAANLKLHKITNVTIITADCLDVVNKIERADSVFCDPERSPSEDVRNIETIQPDLPNLIALYGKLTDNIAIELPPQIQDIPFACEREYISVNHNLNRLTIYLGELKTSETSAVVLPGAHRLESQPAALKEARPAGRYLCEIDDAIAAARLTDQLPGFRWTNDIGTFHTTNDTKETKNPFWKNAYRVIASCDNENGLIDTLRRERIGKIVYRANVTPADYWTQRGKIEQALTGKREATVLISGKERIVAERL